MKSQEERGREAGEGEGEGRGLRSYIPLVISSYSVDV